MPADAMRTPLFCCRALITPPIFALIDAADFADGLRATPDAAYDAIFCHFRRHFHAIFADIFRIFSPIFRCRSLALRFFATRCRAI